MEDLGSLEILGSSIDNLLLSSDNWHNRGSDLRLHNNFLDNLLFDNGLDVLRDDLGLVDWLLVYNFLLVDDWLLNIDRLVNLNLLLIDNFSGLLNDDFLLVNDLSWLLNIVGDRLFVCDSVRSINNNLSLDFLLLSLVDDLWLDFNWHLFLDNLLNNSGW